MQYSIRVTRTEETLIEIDAPSLDIAKQKALYQATEKRAKHPWDTTSLTLKEDKSIAMFFEATKAAQVNGRLPIRHAVIKLGYMILGAGRFKEEAIANAEKNHAEAKGKIIEEAESMELADGEIFLASIENDYFDDYFKDFNCFEKIGENWYFKV